MADSTVTTATSQITLEMLPADLSIAQIAAFLAFSIVFGLYAYSVSLRQRSRQHSADHTVSIIDAEGVPLMGNGTANPGTLPTRAALAELSPIPDGAKDQPSNQNFVTYLISSPLTGVLSLKPDEVMRQRDTLAALAEFCAWMLWFFISDRTRFLQVGTKSYSRDVFMTAFATVIMVAFGSSICEEKRMMTLSRQQTEEWKGWMQVMFLLYHYFEAKEAYNAIRVLIAGYVWMTGYGNFHYYYRTNDYCIGRFAQMMWRLNFLVAACCVILRNNYMLYYICPMHTAFTVLVYAALGIASHINHSRGGMAAKIAMSVVVVMVVWDIPAVFYAVWRPFKSLVAYTDPRKPNADWMHEWFFRSSLDRYIWIWGMVIAWMHPHIESAWARIDGLGLTARSLCRMAVTACTLTALYLWYINVYMLDKLEYNKMHPYTSWIPISAWIILRNLTPQLRKHSLSLLSWLGCITLETYISQFHIWLRSVIPNGQPKFVLDLVPGYPLFNFLLVSVLYFGVSYRLFILTNMLKSSFVPHDDNRGLGRNVLLMGICGVALYLTATAIHGFLYLPV